MTSTVFPKMMSEMEAKLSQTPLERMLSDLFSRVQTLERKVEKLRSAAGGEK